MNRSMTAVLLATLAIPASVLSAQGTRMSLTLTAHCAKDPDRTGLFSSDMYSPCRQDELNKLRSSIASALAASHVVLASVGEDADYQLTVTLTKSMLKSGGSDFSTGTQVFEATYQLADASGRVLHNGTVTHQGSGNDRSVEQEFGAKIASTVNQQVTENSPAAVGGSTTGAANSLFQRQAEAMVQANVFDIMAQAYRSLAVKPALPEDARLEKHKAEDALKSNDPKAAIPAYVAALKSATWWPEGFRGLALALGQTKDPGQAIVWMRRYIEFVPDAQDAQQMQAKIDEWSRLSPPQPPLPSSLQAPPGTHLGVKCVNTPSIVAMSLGKPELEGALVAFVGSGSAAETAGLMKGDIVVSYNDAPVVSAQDLVTHTAAIPPGTTATLVVLRGQTTMSIKVQF